MPTHYQLTLPASPLLSSGCALAAGICLLASVSVAADPTDPIIAQMGNPPQPVRQQVIREWMDANGLQETIERRHIEHWALERWMADQARQDEAQQPLTHRVELDRRMGASYRTRARQHITATSSPSAAEIESQFERIKANHPRPPKWRLYNLFLRYPPNADDTLRRTVLADIQGLRQRILDGESFQQLATLYSQSQSRLRAGLIGNVPLGLLAPQLDERMLQMQAGDLSEPIESDTGVTLLYVEEVFPAVVRNDEEIRELATRAAQRSAVARVWSDIETAWIEQGQWSFRSEPWNDETTADDPLAWFEGQPVIRAREVAQLMGYDLSDAIQNTSWDNVLDRLKHYLAHQQFARYLERHDPETFTRLEQQRSALDQRLLADQWLQSQLSLQTPHVTNEQVRDYFESNNGRWIRPTHFRLRGLALALDTDNPMIAYEPLTEARYELEQGRKSWAAVMEELELAHHLPLEGQWVSRHDLAPSFGLNSLKEILSLEVGELSELTRTDQGFLWIFELLAIEEERPMTLEEARGPISSLLTSDQRTAAAERLRSTWLSELNVRLIDLQSSAEAPSR